MEDCDGMPVQPVDVCEERVAMTTLRDLAMIKRLLEIPGSNRWRRLEAARDLLTRSLEADADAQSFPPAGSVWRQGDSGAVGTVEYAPNGRRWRLLFRNGGRSEWCYEGIAEGWERVFERPPNGSVWRNARQGLTARVEHGKRPGRWRLVYDEIPVGVPCPPASPWRDGALSSDWEPRDTEAPGLRRRGRSQSNGPGVLAPTAPAASPVENVALTAAPQAADAPITIVAESVAIPKIEIGQVWRRGSWVPDGQIRTDMERIRIVRYQALDALWGVEPAGAADSWALCWIGETEIRTAFELESEPVPQAVTLETTAINVSAPQAENTAPSAVDSRSGNYTAPEGYRSPSDVDLPRVMVGQVWRMNETDISGGPGDWSDPALEDNLAIVRALDELIERRAGDAHDLPTLPFGGAR